MTVALRRNEPRALRAAIAIVLAVLVVATAAPVAGALGRLVGVIVVSSDAGEAARITRAHGGVVSRDLPIVDGVSARVPEGRLGALGMRALVVEDRALRVRSASYGDALTSAYPREIGADRVWGDGVAGEGVTVALVDTGVADVADLAGRIVARANFSDEPGFDDAYGHGTFQAGLVAGDGTASDGRYVGIAPEAGIMSVKVAGRDGSTSLGQVLAGIQLVDHAAERFGVRVLLLALDSQSPLPPEIDPLSRALRSVWAHGVVVVVPAGNDGPDSGTVVSPGNDPVLLTAGSVDDRGTPDPSDDVVSEFSGRGPTVWGDEKPDVAAPGEHLVGLRAPGSTVDEENPSARIEDSYFKGTGTSMSAAVTAGAAALLVSSRPDLEPNEVKALLMATAFGVEGGDAGSTGAGVVDAAEAVALDETPDLPDVPPVGDAEPPFTPGGLRFDWVEGEDGTARWLSQRPNDDFEARRWAARRWADEDWAARRWAEEDWAARRWLEREWAARRWAARRWAARQWAARRWASDEWLARQWSARQWSAEDWQARQWVARQWAARQWSARQWSAEDWQARQWVARQWAARQWSARQWSDDDWAARQWSARQWSARQWSARQWSARTWT